MLWISESKAWFRDSWRCSNASLRFLAAKRNLLSLSFASALKENMYRSTSSSITCSWFLSSSLADGKHVKSIVEDLIAQQRQKSRTRILGVRHCHWQTASWLTVVDACLLLDGYAGDMTVKVNMSEIIKTVFDKLLGNPINLFLLNVFNSSCSVNKADV